MDKIVIENLEIFAHHGVFAEETQNGQLFLVSADLFLDASHAIAQDNVELSVNYASVCYFIQKCMQENTFQLIETAAHFVARQILYTYPLLQKAIVRIDKPSAPIGLPFQTVYAQVELSWHTVALGIGSNIGNRAQYIQQALEQLAQSPDVQLLKTSDLRMTKPYGYTQQADFLNGCLLLKTLYTPHALLEFLHAIEASLGVDRRIKIHWGPRTIDLDILLYDDWVMHTEPLSIPHTDLQNRAFVLQPLAQIGGYLWHPVLQKTIEQLWQEHQATQA